MISLFFSVIFQASYIYVPKIENYGGKTGAMLLDFPIFIYTYMETSKTIYIYIYIYIYINRIIKYILVNSVFATQHRNMNYL